MSLPGGRKRDQEGTFWGSSLSRLGEWSRFWRAVLTLLRGGVKSWRAKGQGLQSWRTEIGTYIHHNKAMCMFILMGESKKHILFDTELWAVSCELFHLVHQQGAPLAGEKASQDFVLSSPRLCLNSGRWRRSRHLGSSPSLLLSHGLS